MERKITGSRGTDKRGDVCTEEKNRSRQARGDILLLCCLRLGIACAIAGSRKQEAESRLTDAYPMHFVSRRALLSPFCCGEGGMMRKTRAILSPAREDHGTSKFALAEFRSNADSRIYNGSPIYNIHAPQSSPECLPLL